MFHRSQNSSRTHLLVSFLVLGMALASATNANAQSKKEAPPAKPAGATSADEPGAENKSDKLDVTDLEKKYWAAKDTDFSVVQNRTYSKAGRFALSGAWGFMVNDPYSEASLLSASLSYYFSERAGVELNYTKHTPSDNGAVEYFKTHYGLSPDFGSAKSFYGASFAWVPFYAKMSVLNSTIIYFDMQISPAIGVTTYDQQITNRSSVEKTAPTVGVDVTQHFFLNKHFALRLDYKNRWFQEEVVSAGGTTTAGTKVRDQTTQTSLLLFGATFFF